MKISLGLVTAMPIGDSISFAQTAEKSGYNCVWVGEDIFHREIFTYLSILSLNTKNIGLGTGVTSPYVRELRILESCGKALSKLTRKRFTLGLGTGGIPELKKLTGMGPSNPVQTLYETLRYLKERLDIEIYLGVRGPRNLELGGKIADGVILSGPRGYIKKAIEIVDTASEGRGKVKKVLWNAFYLGEDKKLVSNVTSVMMESMPPFALKYMDMKQIEDELCIFGSKEKIDEEIEAFGELGIDEIVIGPPYGRAPIDAVREFGG
jgi:5,10-methylenetetrahydromethanopterin reductase